jgi:hypothetical protein
MLSPKTEGRKRARGERWVNPMDKVRAHRGLGTAATVGDIFEFDVVEEAKVPRAVNASRLD